MLKFHNNKFVDPFLQKKYQIERKIVEVLLQKVEEESLTVEQTKEIIDYCTEAITKATSRDTLLSFLDEISNKWAMFQEIRQVEQGLTKELDKNIVSDTIMDLVKSGHIEEAADLAKKANE